MSRALVFATFVILGRAPTVGHEAYHRFRTAHGELQLLARKKTAKKR